MAASHHRHGGRLVLAALVALPRAVCQVSVRLLHHSARRQRDRLKHGVHLGMAHRLAVLVDGPAHKHCSRGE